MKIREIILDFTSLLDVIMIILFFFILFSHFENQEIKEQYENDYQSIEEISESLEQKELELEQQLELIASMDSEAANNLQALLEFGNGTNLKAYLKMQNSGWILEIHKKDAETQESEILAGFSEADNISQGIKSVLYSKGYQPEDRIMLEFLYNGTAAGTDNACEQILKAFAEIRREYRYFYYSETDTSVLESE